MKRLSEKLKKILKKYLMRVDYWIYFIYFIGIGSGIIVGINVFKHFYSITPILETILYSIAWGYISFSVTCITIILVIFVIGMLAWKKLQIEDEDDKEE